MKSQESNPDPKKPEISSSSAPKSTRSPYFKGLAMLSLITGYIIGPLVVIGGIGWWLSERFDSLWFVFGGLLVALVVTNVLIFKNTEKQLKKLLKK